MKKFLWINPSILRKDSSQHIQLSDGFHTIEATNKAIQPIIDRTNNYRFYNSKLIFDTSNFAIPNLHQPCPDFEQICTIRSKQIIDAAKTNNKKIVIFYSGGVDSTAMLCSFINILPIAELRDLVYIACNDSSICENPNFYKEVIIGNGLTTIDVTDVCHNNIKNIHENIFVTGDPGLSCNALGKLVTLSQSTGLDIGDKLNYQTLCSKFYENTCRTFNLDLDKTVRDYRTFVEFTANTQNVEVDNMYDFKFWHYLNFRYIANVLWMLLNMPKILMQHQKGKEYWDQHFLAFFHTDLFQIWDYQNRNDGLVYVRNEGHTKYYKPQHKKFINSVYNDPDYRANKGKLASLPIESRSWHLLSYIDQDYLPHWKDEKNAMA